MSVSLQIEIHGQRFLFIENETPHMFSFLQTRGYLDLRYDVINYCNDFNTELTLSWLPCSPTLQQIYCFAFLDVENA